MTGDIRLGVAHQLRNVWRSSRIFVVAALTVTVLLHLTAMITAQLHRYIADADVAPAVLVPLAAGLWSALALLPALGGGDTDDAMALAAAGAGRSFTFGSRFAATITDAGPGLFVPTLAIIGAAAAGWPGWLAGLALAWNGLACGQLARAGSALLVGRLGPTWALATVASLVMLLATVLVTSGLGPGAWWLKATTQPVYDAVLVLTGLLALWGSWALNQPSERSIRPARPVPFPRAVLPALTIAMATGVGRSVAARSTVVTAVIAPLLGRSAGVEVTQSVVFFVMAAAAAVLGANGFAYDGGSAVWLLGKVGPWTMLVARLIATTAWVLALAVIASLTGALVGAPLEPSTIPAVVLVAVAVALSGLYPSVHRPASTDFDSFRAQPAPVASSIGTLTRAVVLTLAILTLPLGAGAAIVAAYAVVALIHARWEMRDPIALAALT